jgi:hypothetical protein
LKKTSIGLLLPLPSGDVGIKAPSPRPNARRFALIPIDLSEANTTDARYSPGLDTGSPFFSYVLGRARRPDHA